MVVLFIFISFVEIGFIPYTSALMEAEVVDSPSTAEMVAEGEAGAILNVGVGSLVGVGLEVGTLVGVGVGVLVGVGVGVGVFVGVVVGVVVGVGDGARERTAVGVGSVRVKEIFSE